MATESTRTPDAHTVTVTQGDEYFVARDEVSGVASQGETKADGLANLAEALELHARPTRAEVEDIEASDAPWC